jgi:DNA-binding response OmpR family regulator
MSPVLNDESGDDGFKKSRSILIVEDEQVLLDLLVYRFTKAEYEVFTAISGAQACEQIGLRKPDLILMDNLLPQLNGLDVLEMLRQHPEPIVATTPVILVTAQTAPEIKEQSLQLGADLFFCKPYSLANLLECSSTLIQQHRYKFILN